MGVSEPQTSGQKTEKGNISNYSLLGCCHVSRANISVGRQTQKKQEAKQPANARFQQELESLVSWKLQMWSHIGKEGRLEMCLHAVCSVNKLILKEWLLYYY